MEVVCGCGAIAVAREGGRVRHAHCGREALLCGIENLASTSLFQFETIIRGRADMFQNDGIRGAYIARPSPSRRRVDIKHMISPLNSNYFNYFRVHTKYRLITTDDQ